MLLWCEFCFEASHTLPQFPEVHGHSYYAKATIAGKADDGYVIPEHQLQQICDGIRWKLDHKHLNNLMEVPTMEGIARFIWSELERAKLLVTRVDVWRPTVRSGVIYEGANADLLQHKLGRAHQELKFMRDALEYAYKLTNPK